MKTKTLLIAISTIILLFFTSCEKDEMDKAGGAGGGIQYSPKTLNLEKTPIPLFNQEDTSVSRDQIIDSLSYNSDKHLNIK